MSRENPLVDVVYGMVVCTLLVLVVGVGGPRVLKPFRRRVVCGPGPRCPPHLRQIGLGLYAYAFDNRRYPPRLDDLVRLGYVEDPQLFVCPSSTDFAADPFPLDNPAGFVLRPGSCSYFYRTPSGPVSFSSATVLVVDRAAHHRDALNVLYGDGSVGRVDLGDAAGLAALRQTMGLPGRWPAVLE